jgi:hypothetical protein
MTVLKYIIFIVSCIGISSYNIIAETQESKFSSLPISTIGSDSTTLYTGWWVYGEGQHIFKDEQTLDEYDLVFANENMEELVELYVSVCEMEYFPMECEMKGTLTGNILTVQAFEILYIQGCGE